MSIAILVVDQGGYWMEISVSLVIKMCNSLKVVNVKLMGIPLGRKL